VPSALSSTVEGLYHAHHNWLTSWLRRRLGCPQSAADLAQDTYLRLLQARETPQLIEPRAFLATVAKRVLCNHFRRQELERAYLQALAQIPEEVAPSEEQKAIIFETTPLIMPSNRLGASTPNHARQALRQAKHQMNASR